MTEHPRVLIVDDSERFVATSVDLFREKGFPSIGAQDPETVMDLVQRIPFEVVLLDVKMPAMDGITLSRRIRRVRPGAAILLMSALGLEELVGTFLRQRAFVVLRDPTGLEGSLARLKEGEAGLRFILVVQDGRNLGARVLRSLEARRVPFFRAAGARSVKRRLAENMESGLAVLDDPIPPLNGLMAYLEVREAHPEAAVLALTAPLKDAAAVVAWVLRKGVYGPLRKPFDMERMVCIIDGILAEGKRR